MRAIVLALVLAGCSGSEAPTAPTPAAPPPAPTAPAAPPAEVAWKVLAPSPLAIEAELREAGLGDALPGLVPATLPALAADASKDRVAFRTGVVFAYTVLGGRTADKATFLTNIRALRDGMAAIGTGAGVLATMDKAILQVENDTASREDFLAQLDEVVSMSVPTEGWGPGDTTGPLLQAGAWLAGTNLSAKAIVASNNAAAADKLLRRPEVAGFFLKYVKSEEGAQKADALSPVVAKTLGELEVVGNKPSIGVAEAQAVVASTDALLNLL